MACIINDGYKLGCASVGGAEKVYIGTYDADAAYTLDADNVITGVTSGGTVYLFEQDIESAGVEQNGVYNRENGTTHYESILSVKLFGLDAKTRNLAVSLGRAPVFAIVKSNAGQHYLLGMESAGRATEGTASLGVSMEDMNGVNMSFTFKSKDGMFLIDESILGTDITIG